MFKIVELLFLNLQNEKKYIYKFNFATNVVHLNVRMATGCANSIFTVQCIILRQYWI